ncbi:MAG: hypothetical protein KQI78_03005 [Deltaproteobacteria bacterium]|nr:hypothetical protein [Deltaproteobacteria bacterium]
MAGIFVISFLRSAIQPLGSEALYSGNALHVSLFRGASIPGYPSEMPKQPDRRFPDVDDIIQNIIENSRDADAIQDFHGFPFK